MAHASRSFRSYQLPMSLQAPRVVGWLLAFAIASGIGILGVASKAEVARGFVEARDFQEYLWCVASPGVAGAQFEDLRTAPDPALQLAIVSEHHSGWKVSDTAARRVYAPSLHRPTFPYQVSYWPTGPPSVS